ncbi:MAG: dihydrodipicolinate synthase family protein [Candidatus Lokiarchaeota archaeon]|nr:dihydrodipicolinate synthase family protein [Candidatus Lokiarchaeota archaeon]
MNDYELLERTRGVIAPLVTWLDANGDVDTGAMCQHVEYLLKNGCNGGIFLLGSTGEGPYLALEEKRSVVHDVVNCVNGRVPVIAGLASHGVRPAIELAHLARMEGADATMAVVPQYFDLQPADIDLYYRKLAAGLKREIPLLMYYAPPITTSHPKISPELVFKLAKDKAICGIKATVVEWDFIAELRRLLKGDYTAHCNVWVGTDRVLIDCLKNGVLDIDGVIVSGVDMFPDFYNVLLHAFREKPRDEAKCKALEKISDVIRQMFTVAKAELPTLVKQALKHVGLPFARNAGVTPPLPSLSPERYENMLKCIDQLRAKGITF